MAIDARVVYENMFQALNAAWSETHNRALGDYLSDANPWLWSDKGSADPAVWTEFKSAFEMRFPHGCASPEEAHEFVEDYLAKMSSIYEEWTDEGPCDFVADFVNTAEPGVWTQNLLEEQQ